MERKLCYLYLTCAPGQEQRLARALLEKRLINCAKFVPINCSYWWQGDIVDEKETLIVMESAEDLFDEIEAELTTLHKPDETFVLELIPVARASRKADKWITGELRQSHD